MRAVTRAAGVSVSAANYHFGSKEALLLATLGRVVVPLNRERAERLDELERASCGQPLALEAVLEAFLAPAVEQRDPSLHGDDFRQLAARLYSDPPEVVAVFKQENFGPLSDRFTEALQRVLSDRDPAQIELAFQFVVGMMVHVIAGQLGVATESAPVDASGPSDSELLASLIAFAAGGLRALPRITSGSSPCE